MVEEIFVIESITIIYRKKKIEAPPVRIQPIHICVPGPFPYQSTKAVPWRYDTTTYIGGKEIQFSYVEIDNIARTGGMTHSGHVFAMKYTLMVSPSPAVIPLKEKVLPISPPQAGASASTTLVVTTVPAMKKVIPDKVVES